MVRPKSPIMLIPIPGKLLKKTKKKGKTVFNVLGNGSYLFLHQAVSNNLRKAMEPLCRIISVCKILCIILSFRKDFRGGSILCYKSFFPLITKLKL